VNITESFRRNENPGSAIRIKYNHQGPSTAAYARAKISIKIPERGLAVSLTAPALLQRHRRGVRYCSFVDNVSYIVNESIRPDLIVGRNKARRDAPRVTDAFICGNVMCRVPQERNVSTSGYVSRPMTIALDYTRRKTILAVSLLGRGASRHSALIYARIRRASAEGGGRRKSKGNEWKNGWIIRNPAVWRPSASRYA